MLIPYKQEETRVYRTYKGGKLIDEFLGKEEKILVEREIADGIFEGHMTNYIKVHVKSDEDISKKIITVKIEKCEKDYLVAKTK